LRRRAGAKGVSWRDLPPGAYEVLFRRRQNAQHGHGTQLHGEEVMVVGGQGTATSIRIAEENREWKASAFDRSVLVISGGAFY